MKRDDSLHMVRRICLALMMAAILMLGVGCGGAGSSESGMNPKYRKKRSNPGSLPAMLRYTAHTETCCSGTSL